MDKPLWILLDALEEHGLSWEETKQIAAPITEDEDMLDLAEWIAQHPEATLQEIRKEMHRLLELGMR